MERDRDSHGRFLGLPKYAKKKRCPHCGKMKWKREFYTYKKGKKKGQLYAYCKDCCREIKMSRYHYGKPERIVRCSDGRLHVVKAGGPGSYGKTPLRGRKLYWSESMLEYLRRCYPTTPIADMMPVLHCGARTIQRKARELGIKKSAEWMHRHSVENCKKMRILNRAIGNSGMIKKGERRSPETEFKKGHRYLGRPANEMKTSDSGKSGNND